MFLAHQKRLDCRMPRRLYWACALTLAAVLAACGGNDTQRPDHPSDPPPSANQGPLYSFTPIGLPGMVRGEVNRDGIANGGLVAGTAWDSAGTGRAFRFDGEHTVDLGSFGGNGARAFSINACGQVAGWALASGDVPRAFLFDGTLHDLGTLGGETSHGTLVSDCGKVAGWSNTAGQQAHAFYHDGRSMRDIGTFGGSASTALAINGAGQVVGYASGPGDAWYHAFLYDARSGLPLQDLGPQNVNSLAVDINDKGQVAGNARHADGALRAFRYNAGTLHDLGLLPGSQGSDARAISAAGHVVGYAYFTNGRRVAFVHDGERMRSLGALGKSTSSDAVAVNHAGLVVGSSFDPATAAEHAIAWGSDYGMVDLNKRVRNLPSNLTLVAALAVADDGAIVVRTDTGLGLLRPLP